MVICCCWLYSCLLVGEWWLCTLSAWIDSDVSHLPSVPYIYVADNIVAPTRVNAEPTTQSSRGVVPPGFEFPSLEHGYMLLLVVLVSSWGVGMAVYTVCMNWSTFFPLAIGPVHICCRQYRGTNSCERGAHHAKQSRSGPSRFRIPIIRAWLYVVVGCTRVFLGGGDGCVHCLHELIHIFSTCHRSRTYMLQTISWHQPVWTRSPVRTRHGGLNAVEERSPRPSRGNSL